jgi:DNA-directed RNA polymerase beta' subunit
MGHIELATPVSHIWFLREFHQEWVLYLIWVQEILKKYYIS